MTYNSIPLNGKYLVGVEVDFSCVSGYLLSGATRGHCSHNGAFVAGIIGLDVQHVQDPACKIGNSVGTSFGLLFFI